MNLPKELNRLKRINAKSKTAITENKNGKIIISTKYTGQYYLKDKDTGKWEYISKKDAEALKFVKEIAQQQYEKRIIAKTEKQIRVIEYFLKNYNPACVKEIYESMSEVRKALIKPYEVSDEEFIYSWLNKPYVGNTGYAIEKGYKTQNGETVRSKSEVMIADRLYAKKIPYKYECPLLLDGTILYPDFTILNINTREEVILEHFGMLENPEYGRRFVKKMQLYAKHRVFPGDKLIFTLECEALPFDPAYLEMLLDAYGITPVREPRQKRCSCKEKEE